VQENTRGRQASQFLLVLNQRPQSFEVSELWLLDFVDAGCCGRWSLRTLVAVNADRCERWSL
jgi:hypothetical protein